MEWIAMTLESTVSITMWMIGLGLGLGLLGWLMPCNRGMYWWTDMRSFVTNICYWLVALIIVRVGRAYMLAIGVALVSGGGPPGFTVLSTLPIWVQCVLIQLMQDVYLYWMHRAFHTPIGWRFHSVHHSPTVLDWLAGARNHVLNSLATFIMADIIALLLGFSMDALVMLAPFNIIWSSLVHANLNWSFGPFKYVISSPVFHRWHHTMEAEGLNKNFAPTFPVLDVIFGTFYMPAGKLPVNFGNGEADYPEGFVGQFLYPFLGRKPEPEVVPQRKAA